MQSISCFLRGSVLFMLCLSALLHASPTHQGSLRGLLFDTQTQTPVVGAEIYIEAVNQRLYSGELGHFFFKNLPEGRYELTITRLGYESMTRFVVIDSNQTTPLRLGLTPRDIQVDAITISEQLRPGTQLPSIQALDLQLRPLRTSQDVLKMVPGLFIAQHAGGGKAEQIFLRGFDIDHGTDIALTVDGMPVNMVSHAHGQGYSDLHFVIPETIEDVDFAKGPYDSRYGNFATAGYAAFQTKNALAQSQLKLEGGQFNTLRGVGLIDLLPGNERHHAYIASEYMRTDGYFEAPQNFTRRNVLAKYHGQIGDRSLLTVSASHFASEWDASGQIPLRAVERGLIGPFGAIDSTEGGHTGRSNLNLQLTQVLGEGELLKHQVFYSRYDFTLYSNFTFFLEDSVNGDQIQQSETRDIFGYQGSYQREYAVGGTQMRSEIGLSLRADEIRDNELSRTRNRDELLERLAYGDVRETSVGVYLDHTWWATRWLSMNAGLRYDQFRFQYENQLTELYDPKAVTKGIVSPKLNINATLSPRVRLYLSGGTGFHSNDSRVVLANTTDDILPRAYGSDVGLVVKPLKGLLVHAAAWGLWLDQEFVYVGDAGIVEPSGETRRVGADLSVRYQATRWLSLDADVTYTYARALGEAEGESYIPLAPIFTSIGGATLRLPCGLEGSLRYRYLGDRPANEDFSVVAEGYFLLDAVLQYRFRDVQLSIAMENLTNALWREAQFDTESLLRGEGSPTSEIHFTPGTPRFARVGMSYFF